MNPITLEQYQEALKVVQEYKTQLQNHYNQIISEVDSVSKFADHDGETLIIDTNISVRLINILVGNLHHLVGIYGRDAKIKDMEGMSMRSFLKCRNVGKETLKELQELCFYAGVTLSK